jgi:hypothetical protein
MGRALNSGLAALWIAVSASAATAVTGDPTAIDIAKKMIEAHGGMQTWEAAPSVAFEDSMIPAGAGFGLRARVIVEQGRRRASLEYPSMNTRLGWDGKMAWGYNWNLPYPPRFIALLDYYFLNLPWLTMDPGVILGAPGKGKLWDDPVEYTTLKMTFEPGVGDTPGDYYVLYVHPDNHMLHACRYIVTYASLLPEGMSATPEHILIYDRYKNVGGLIVPVHYTIYETDKKPYASCDIEGWSFSRPFDPALVSMPEGAVVDNSKP